MAKDKSIYVCNECGGTNPKWLGKCPHCGAWNSLEETAGEPASGGKQHRFQSLAKSAPVAGSPAVSSRAPTSRARPPDKRSWTACSAAASCPAA
jgi:predicted ATP-dependent serine protease